MSAPTERQQYYLDRLQANIDKAKERCDRAAARYDAHIAWLVEHGGDPDAPTTVSYGADEDGNEEEHKAPSLNWQRAHIYEEVRFRQRDYDQYVEKLRAKGVEV